MSKLVVDDMPNITGNFSDELYEHSETPYEKIFLELFTVIGLLSVASNSLLIFIILKYKKMMDVTNMIFLQVNILQAVYLFAAPLTLRVGMTFLSATSVYVATFCVSYQIETTLMFAITWFLFLLTCDWYLKLYHKDSYVKFCRVYKFFIVFIYVLVIFVCSITVQMCFKSLMVAITYLILLVSVLLIVIFLIVINIIHAIKKRRVLVTRKGHIGLTVSNICFSLWCPTLFFLLVTMATEINAPVLLIVLFSFGFSSPIFNLVYLFYFDDNFNVFLKQVFTCKCNEYKNESLEDKSVSYNDMDGVEIPEN